MSILSASIRDFPRCCQLRCHSATALMTKPWLDRTILEKLFSIAGAGYINATLDDLCVIDAP